MSDNIESNNFTVNENPEGEAKPRKRGGCCIYPLIALGALIVFLTLYYNAMDKKAEAASKNQVKTEQTSTSDIDISSEE